MVDQHAESTRRSGLEIVEERLDVIEAVESFDDDTFDPKIVAPHPFEELCIMDTFHDDARHASGSGSGTGNGHRTRRGSGCRRGVRWRPPQGDRRAVDDERPGSSGKCRTSPVLPAIETSLDRTDSTVPENPLPRCATRIPTRASTIGYLVASRSRGPTGPARMPPETCRDFTTANVARRPLQDGHCWPALRQSSLSRAGNPPVAIGPHRSIVSRSRLLP